MGISDPNTKYCINLSWGFPGEASASASKENAWCSPGLEVQGASFVMVIGTDLQISSLQPVNAAGMTGVLRMHGRGKDSLTPTLPKPPPHR